MTLKVYIASITANTEIRKQVQRVVMVLDGMGVDYEAVDITAPGKEQERDFMRTHGKPREGQTVALPPQIFYDEDFIGDYEAFDNAVEDNQLLPFLRLGPAPSTTHDGPAVSKTQMNGETANGHEEEKEDEEAVEEGEGEDVEDEEGAGEEGEEGEEGEKAEGEEGEDEEGEAEGEEGEEKEKEAEKAADEEEEIVEDPEIEDEEGEGEGEEGEAADEEEEEDVEDVEIEDEEEGNAAPVHSATSLVDCSRVLSRRRDH